MSRKCSFPSMAQVEKLLECLDERSYLATGHARTSYARERTRAAWKDIALKLNSDGSGCIKTWQQWAKYWKDKKAAVKSKANKIKTMARQTGVDQNDYIALTVIEQRIVDLMGGDGFTSGDRELEINFFHPSTVDPLHQNTDHTQTEHSIKLDIEDDTQSENETPGSESSLNDEQQVGRSAKRGTQNMEYQHKRELLDGATPGGIASPPSAVQLNHVASASPRRRSTATERRRVTQRTPAQRHFRMASLTERFISIEEKRLENEISIIHNQKKMYKLFLDITKAMSNQTEAIKELCQATRALAEKKN